MYVDDRNSISIEHLSSVREAERGGMMMNIKKGGDGDVDIIIIAVAVSSFGGKDDVGGFAGDKHKLIVCRPTATFVCDTVVAHQSEKIIIANRLVFPSCDCRRRLSGKGG